MDHKTAELASAAKGFLSEAEGFKLFELAVESSNYAPCLEIGSYCGKSTIFLAEGCRTTGKHHLFCVDHHHGSAEQQRGEAYFDDTLYDAQADVVCTVNEFIRNVRAAGLLDWVIPVMTRSERLGRYWPDLSLSLVFIDGGHAEEDVMSDFNVWSTQIMTGGYLCFHDIFADPAEGGQAPYHMFQRARENGDWSFVDQVETLGILRRR